MTQSEVANKSRSTANQKKNNFQQSPREEKRGLTLRGRLLIALVPTILAPLIVAGTWGWIVIHQNIRNQYENRLQEQSLLVSQVSNETLSNLLKVLQQLGKTPQVIEETKSVNELVEAQNLLSQSFPKLEQQYSENKLLTSDPNLNQYLQELGTPQKLGEADQIGELLITDKNGFNVAYNEEPTNLIQKDQPWWQRGKASGEWVGNFQVNEITGKTELTLVKAIRDPETRDLLGLTKMTVFGSAFEGLEGYLENTALLETTKLQILDTSAKQVFTTVTPDGVVNQQQTQGGEAIEEIARSLIEGLEQAPQRSAPEQVAEQYDFAEQFGLEETNLQFYTQEGRRGLIFQFVYQGRKYYMTTIPQTEWVAISAVNEEVLQTAGNELIGVFLSAGTVLGIVALLIGGIIARQLSSPLINVSESAEKAASGNLSVRAQVQGGAETRTLAKSFNNLVERVQALLKEQEASSEQQRRQREDLEEQVSQLMSDMEGAGDGDLTARARLLEGDMGIVADLFNSVVENLQDTARQVKTAATQVSDSLGENESSIRQVAQSAIAQAEEIQGTLNSVEEMTQSIEQVAANAEKAANVADQAFLTAQEGNQTMDDTVNSIQELRSTVGETAKQINEMGKSAEQITEVVSLIDEISLKTTLLAMNTSVEAYRSGEYGQGFTVVAEQIESLSEQSATAAKQIAQIANKIQVQTSETMKAMEQGNQEVLETARSVEQTKARLSDVVERSEEINRIMQSISQSTGSQAETSQAVSQLMKQVTKSSQESSQISKDVAQKIQETAQVARKLESSVDNFQVEK